MPPRPAICTSLAALAECAALPGGAEWLAEELDAIVGKETARFLPTWAAAGRRLGTALVADRAPAPAAHVARDLGFALGPTTAADECGRGALLAAAWLGTDADAQLVSDLVRRGEVRERQAVLRMLAAGAQPERFVATAIDACRTNAQSVFEAIACDNPYPARYFPEPAFNQMVLKALFIGAPARRIVGLAGRLTPELVRMVEAYASERRAAGRPVPDDAEWLRSGAR